MKTSLIAIIFIGFIFGFGFFMLQSTITSVQDSILTISDRVEVLEAKIQNMISDALGSFLPVGGKNYFLYAGGAGSTDTSITLTAFKQPVNDYNYAMADFGSEIGFITLEPSSATRQEFVSFTGITQNSDGTATLTGVTRGLGGVSPFSASTTLQKAHPGGTIAVISNPPAFYKEFTKTRNNEYITGTWGFSANATSTSDCTTGTQYCRKNYIDGVAIAGAGTSTESSMGIGQLATSTQSGNGVASSSQGRPIFLHNGWAATSTESGTCENSGVFCVVVAVAGKIAQNFLDLTAAFTWTGLHTFNNATTTIRNGFTWGPRHYLPPYDAPATSTVLMIDEYNGTIASTTWGGVCRLVNVSTTSVSFSSSAAEELLWGIIIPAHTLGTSGVLSGNLFVSDLRCGGGGTLTIKTYYGSTAFGSNSVTCTNNRNTSGLLDFQLTATSSASQQDGWYVLDSFQSSGTDTSTGLSIYYLTSATSTPFGYAAINSQADQQFRVTAQFNTSNANNAMAVRGGKLEICK